ncbi:hypothetical protein ACH79_08310 [Bradyrhizobium sp. CCBAU 051011]|uniref:hypothetical protein n=1 Tax=Bradyrhizobium sp. CCBAU 051011 TaxID=858422 RepID=UPI001374535E|nr:hypothetical protein [Bradyrhizobium sp. CCBAU 051011]QHO72620.1 hypothetical protein ACH79_08310 [Bradyrhizobium sp. CCBAU 051011]
MSPIARDKISSMLKGFAPKDRAAPAAACFTNPTGSELICPARKRNFIWLLGQTGTTGKSFLIFRNRVKSPKSKYSASVLAQISRITPLVSPQDEGRFAIVTNAR